MYPIKQSTNETILFFAHDVNGDGVTGLTDGGFTKRISKGSGAFGAMTATITEMENGWYSFPLTTSHSDTLGLLSVSISHASTKRVNLQWRVSARTLDELASPTNITAATGVDITKILGTAISTPATAGILDVNVKNMNNVAGTAITTIKAVQGLAVDGVVPTVTAVTGLTAANLDAAITTRMATYTQPTGFLAATFPGTVASTTNITAGTITTTTSVTNPVTADIVKINGATAGAVNLDQSTLAIGYGTAAGSGSSTVFATTALTPDAITADQFKGRVLIFKNDTTTTQLRGQATTISSHTFTSAEVITLTVVALTVAPAAGDTFVIL